MLFESMLALNLLSPVASGNPSTTLPSAKTAAQNVGESQTHVLPRQKIVGSNEITGQFIFGEPTIAIEISEIDRSFDREIFELRDRETVESDHDEL